MAGGSVTALLVIKGLSISTWNDTYKMDSHITKQLIFNYLSGQATPIEIQQVDEWLNDPVHLDTFYEYLFEWEKTHAQFRPDFEAALNRFWEREARSFTQPEAVASPIAHPEELPVRQNLLARFIWVAASVLLLLGTGYLNRDKFLYETIKTGYGEIAVHTLPDGSKVVMNANSVLKWYRFSTIQKQREVWLEGEAEFSVIHTNDHQRFLVKTPNDFVVEVLGTEFSLFSRNRGTKVVLNNGKIRVNYQKDGKPNQLTMKPGELLTMDKTGNLQLKTTESPEEHQSWRERRFVFDRTPVKDICHLLEENFGVTVLASGEEIARKTISGNFKTETADELLDILREVLNLETNVRNDTLFLQHRLPL